MAEPYSSSPVFDQDSLPAALRSQHTTKAGVWGVARMLEGRARLTFIDPPSQSIIDPDNPGVLPPEQLHFVEPLGAMKMQVDFYREPPEV